MGMFVTKDPNASGALTLTTSDPSKGFGAGTLFESKPESELTGDQKELRYRSGAMQRPEEPVQPKPYKNGGSVRGWGKARGAKKCKVR
jgi:hypothetical protein